MFVIALKIIKEQYLFITTRDTTGVKACQYYNSNSRTGSKFNNLKSYLTHTFMSYQIFESLHLSAGSDLRNVNL